ncbi:hypothetical protein HMPREF0653_00641 [Prevotella disiens JCM 6334 = ATCC 29426]|uniref:Uncharacterized protein n=1 Tax=Prevotella disiens JCM 6334 = ATCC 29426 TaxID=1235811 RepID=A0ABN0NU94_9BACT|nr:hypothetical protein HMPREF0653_00641 [Prevotella disiens JCM 6334 = ATCC 29426]
MIIGQEKRICQARLITIYIAFGSLKIIALLFIWKNVLIAVSLHKI